MVQVIFKWSGEKQQTKQKEVKNENDTRTKTTVMYLWRVVDPLSIDKKLVLVLSLWQVQDGYKVIVAVRDGKEILDSQVKAPQLSHTGI